MTSQMVMWGGFPFVSSFTSCGKYKGASQLAVLPEQSLWHSAAGTAPLHSPALI